MLAGMILYADETVTNTIRGKTYYPIYLSLANHEIGYRSSRVGKYLVGFLPVLSCPSSVTSATARRTFGIERTRILHRCWEFLWPR